MVEAVPDEFIPLRTIEPPASRPTEKEVSALDTLKAAGVAANMPYRVYRYGANRSDATVDPDYSPFDDIKGTRYEADPMRFANAQNREDTQAIMREWDEDDAAREVLSKSGSAGTVAMIGMGLVDPTIFMPVAKVFTGVKAGTSALRLAGDTALAGAYSSALSEAAMMATTPEMTPGDYATNVGTATVLSGILGAGAGALLSRAERKAIETKLHQDRLDWGSDVFPSPQSAGAAASDTRNVKLVRTPLDMLPGGDPLGKLSPTRRILNSPFQSARRGLVDLAETPYLFEGNAEGKTVTNAPALDRLVKLSNRKARLGLSDQLDGAFYRYRLGTQDANILQRVGTSVEDIRGATGGKLTRSEFKDAIDDALRNGDQHAIPEVAETATYIRNNIINPWRDRAIKAGILPEGVDVDTAASYMMRSWNKQKLTAQRPAVVERFTDWLDSEQSRKAGIKDNLTGLARQLDEIEVDMEKLAQKAQGGSDAYIAAQGRADVLRGQIEEQLKAWKGKSANEALSAIKSRDKAARPEGSPRLTAADKAVSKAMRKIVESDRNLSRSELSKRASEIVDRILGNPDGRLPYDDASSGGAPAIAADGARGPLASREFMIPDNMIREWLNTDIEQTLNQFLNTIVPDVMMTERFGDVDMLEVFRKLRDEHDAMSQAATSEKARTKLKSQYDAAVADLAAVRDRIRGTYGNVTDPRMRMWGRMASNVGKYNQLTDMGGVTISSLADLSGAIFHYGLQGAFKHQIRPLLRLLGSKEMKAGGKAAKQELRAMGIGIETVMQTRNAAFADVFDMYQPMSKFERGLDKASNAYFVANLLSPWTDAMQRIAGTVSMDQFAKAIEARAAGKASKAQLRKLGESGIDDTMAERIWSQMNAEGGSNVVDGVRLSNSGAWDDTGARDAWEAALARDVDMMVLQPGQEKSLAPTRSPAAALLLQYKTFVMAATERILFRSMQARDAQVLQGFVAAIGLGMLGEYAYSLVSGREPPEGLANWTKAGLGRSGALGWLEEFNAVHSKWTGGATDMYRLIGADSPGSRYLSRDKLGILLGPTANKIDGLAQAGSNAVTGEWGDADTRRMRRLVAGQNLFYIRRLIDSLGQE